MRVQAAGCQQLHQIGVLDAGAAQEFILDQGQPLNHVIFAVVTKVFVFRCNSYLIQVLLICIDFILTKFEIRFGGECLPSQNNILMLRQSQVLGIYGALSLFLVQFFSFLPLFFVRIIWPAGGTEGVEQLMPTGAEVVQINPGRINGLVIRQRKGVNLL